MRELPAQHDFLQGHMLSGQRCPNRHGSDYDRFETLLFRLFSDEISLLLASLVPQPEQDNIPSRTRLTEINRQIEKKQAAAAAECISGEDFNERVRAGIARINSPDEIEDYNARQALHVLLSARIEVVLSTDRRIGVLMRGDRRTGFVVFTPDDVIDAETLDANGNRLGDCREIRAGLGMTGMKQPAHAATQRTSHP